MKFGTPHCLIACVLLVGLGFPIQDDMDFEEVRKKISNPDSLFRKQSLVLMTSELIKIEKDEKLISQCRRIENLDFGHRIERSSDWLESTDGPTDKFPFLAIYNSKYSAGIINGKGDDQDRFLENVKQHSPLESESRHPFAYLFFPIQQQFLLSELAEHETVSNLRCSKNGNEVVIWFNVNTDQEYKVTIDLNRGICIRQEYHIPDPGFKFVFSCEFDDQNSKIPASLHVELDQYTWKTKRTKTIKVVSSESTDDISKKMTFLSFYGLPEPEFSDANSNGLSSFFGYALLLTVLVVATFVAKKIYRTNN